MAKEKKTEKTNEGQGSSAKVSPEETPTPGGGPFITPEGSDAATNEPAENPSPPAVDDAPPDDDGGLQDRAIRDRITQSMIHERLAKKVCSVCGRKGMWRVTQTKRAVRYLKCTGCGCGGEWAKLHLTPSMIDAEMKRAGL